MADYVRYNPNQNNSNSEVNTMTFSQIFAETMGAMARNDYARVLELEQIQKQKIAELRSKKNEQKQRTQKGFSGR
jgi:hypothetical protein